MVKPGEGRTHCETFETIAMAHFDTVYHVARLLTRHADDAQDLTQETYGKAYRAWDGFEPGTTIRAWLLTISCEGVFKPLLRCPDTSTLSRPIPMR